MSAAKTAKLLNDLLDSQKTDRARIKQLEGRLAEADARQTAAVDEAERKFRGQVAEIVAPKDEQITGLRQEVADKDWQITALKQELSGARQLLAAADASNAELRTLVETLGDNLDKATQAAADVSASLDAERAEIAQQREALNHLLDEVRERLRRKDHERESAILNRKMLVHAAPGVNRR